MDVPRESKSKTDSVASKKHKKAVKRKRNSTEDSDSQDKPAKNKRTKLLTPVKYGFLGVQGDQNFADGIPFYIPTRAYHQLVRELTSKSATCMTNAAVVTVFDMSGVGKTTLFKEAAKAAGAYCFAVNTSNAGPFVNLHETAKSAINPFSDGSARQEYVMPILDNIFKHAFAIMLNEIKDHLVNGLTNNWCLLQRNGLDNAINSGVTPNPQSVLLEIAALLKGRPAIILNDDIQVFATHLTTMRQNSLPGRVYEQYNKEKRQYGWKDFLVVAFYRVVFALTLVGRQHRILFCQAGTFNFENIFPGPACKSIESISSCLPLELFDMDKCKTLFDRFWHFNITNKEKEGLLGQLLGPPILMEYFFRAISTIEKSADKVTCEDLQNAVDRAIASHAKTTSQQLCDVDDGACKTEKM